MAFLEYRMVCPHCNSSRYQHNHDKGFHPLARYYCKKCKRTFFKPQAVKQVSTSSVVRIEKKSKHEYKHHKGLF